MERMNKSIFYELCDYYLVSGSVKILENKEARESYKEIGCYDFNGINYNCMIYLNQRRKNYE